MALRAVLYTCRSESQEWNFTGTAPTSGPVRVYKVSDDGSVVLQGVGSYPLRLEIEAFPNNYLINPFGYDPQYPLGASGIPPWTTEPSITPGSASVPIGFGDPVCFYAGVGFGPGSDEMGFFASEDAFTAGDPPLFTAPIPADAWDGLGATYPTMSVAVLRGAVSGPFWTDFVGTQEDQ
jgi:hypothetical protein